METLVELQKKRWKKGKVQSAVFPFWGKRFTQTS
jgi:hypothetical protein